MILRRLGNKSRIAHKIIPYFPPHKIYVEPFFGAGGMFFQKPQAPYNILNDLDSDVYNLWNVVSNEESLRKFTDLAELMPIHSDLLAFWKENTESDPIRKAARFIFLSNYGLYGKPDNITFRSENTKKILLENLKLIQDRIKFCQFSNFDFEKCINSLSFRSHLDIDNTLIYCDPPYLGTTDNYSNSFTESDSLRLFNVLQESGCKFAISEFDNPFILEQAKQRNLNIIEIGERQSLKNRNMEILITNYKPQNTLF